MRVRLKGIHKVRAKGVDYYYAWRGGPRLVGAPGSPEFIASYTAAHASHREPPKDKFHSIIIAYKSSPEFAGLRPSTQRDYRRHIAAIEVAFGDLPLAALEDARVNRDLLQWRDSFAASPRTADYVWAVLQAVLRWGRDHGLTTYRPPDRVSQLYHVDRSDMIWSEADIAKFLAVASEPLQRALILAIESGQRQGDLLTLPWSAYDGAWIRLRQSKTGRRVNVPVTKTLRRVLDSAPRLGPVILTGPRGRPWSPAGFRFAWLKAMRKAGVTAGLHFHDLRGSSITRLAEAGCTHAQIAAISGHSLAHVGSILDRYLARTDRLAVAAIARLERGRA